MSKSETHYIKGVLNMYEYRVVNRKTEQETTIFGRTFIDACRRWKVEPAELMVIDCEYVD
jgi:hypothetical protein